MNYKKIHKEIARAIEEILEDNKVIINKSILLFSDTDQNILEALYDLLTNSEESEKIHFTEGNYLHSWKKELSLAVCFITDDLPNSKYSYSQGYAVKIRDLSRKTNSSLLYIATPDMLNLDSLATAGINLSKTFLSRRKIIHNQITKLQNTSMNSYLQFFESFIANKSDSYIYQNFEDLFNFFSKSSDAKKEADLAEQLYLIELIKDDEFSFSEIYVKGTKYLEINMEISSRINEAIKSGESVYYILDEYCLSSKAQEVDSWIRHQPISKIKEIFRNWPEEYYLSKIVTKVQQTKPTDHFSFHSIELDKEKHTSNEHIFSTSTQEVYCIFEEYLSLIFNISKPLTGQEKLSYQINGSLKKRPLPVPTGETRFKVRILKKDWKNGLNYITFGYQPSPRSKVKISMIYYFIFNDGSRSWEIYEINCNLEGNYFYIDETITDCLVLAVVGKPKTTFKILKVSYENESSEDLEVTYKLAGDRKQIIISTDELEDEGTLKIRDNDEYLLLYYKIYREEHYAEKSNSIYDVLIRAQFGKEPNLIKLGDRFKVKIESTIHEKFGEPIINYLSYVNKAITLRNQSTNETYVIEYPSSLFKLEHWFLSKRAKNPFPSYKKAEQKDIPSSLEVDLSKINSSWSLDRINIIKEMNEYNNFVESRKELFNSLCSKHKEVDLPIFCINLLNYEKAIYKYAFSYLSLLSTEKNIYQKEEKVFDYKSIILFFDFVFIQNNKNTLYICLMSPLHPLMLLNQLLKQKQIYKWFNVKENINKISRYDIEKIKQSSIPFLLNLGKSSESDAIFDTTYLKLNSRFDNWGIYIHLPEKRKGYEQNKKMDEGTIISEILDFTSLDQGYDLTKVIQNKIENYILSHPYLLQRNTTININFINPSRGKHLLDALLKLNKKKQFQEKELRYNINLFSRDDIPSHELGGSFVEFFSKANPNDFEAKMMSSISYVTSNVSPNRRRDFQETIDVVKKLPYANLTFISGIFHNTLKVSSPKANRFSSTQSGIFSFLDTKFDPLQNRFYRGIFTYPINNARRTPNTDDDFITLYNQLLHTMACFSASIHQNYDENNLMSLMLEIEPRMEEIIHCLHKNTDWACFIDQDLGIELFDRGLDEQVEYLIDFSPPFENQISHSNVIVTTEQVDYIRSIMKTQLKLLCKHEIDKEKTMNMLLSSLNYLAGSWALSALKDEYPNLTGKLGEVLALFELLKNNKTEPLVKMTNGDICSIRIVIPNYHYINAWKEDDSQEFSKLSDDLLEIIIERNSENPENFNITMIPIEVKHGESASTVNVLTKAKEQIESSYLILKHRFHRFGDYNSSLRDIELATLLEKNVRRFFRYFETDKLLKVNEFLIDVIDKIQKQQYETFFGYQVNGKLLYGKVFSFDPFISSEDIDPDLVREGIFIFDLEKIATLLDIREEIKEPELEAVKDKIETHIKASQETFTSVETVKEEVLETEIEPLKIDVENPISTLKEDLEEVTSETTIEPVLQPEVFLGTSSDNIEEWGIIGEYQNKKVAINLNEPLTIVVMGAKGSGKSYTTGVVIEAAQNLPPGLNKIKSKLQTIIFHFHQDSSYAPEFLSLIDRNDDKDELNNLLDKYNQNAAPLGKIKLFVTPRSYAEQKKKYEKDPKIEVYPLFFHPEDLGIKGWKLLLFADSNDALYIQVIHEFLNELYYGEKKLTPDNLLSLVEADEELSQAQKKLAIRRITLAKRYISKENHAFKYINKGDVVIVDVREKLMDKNTAMSLFLIFARIASERGEGNKVIVFDEAHKYFSTSMKEEIVTLNREIRHRGVSLIVSSQDPKSIADTIIELSEIVIIHKLVVPHWLKLLKRKLSSMENVQIGDLSKLQKGEALIWAKEASRLDFTMGMQKIKIRPRSTKHGGRSIKNV
ncbi:MAG: ATP-binding protein [Candidatus Heimdallarchaeaceae archaeon]